MSFGDFLKEERKKKGLTMRELERRTGISQAYISQIESGKRNAPKPDLLRKLSKGLDVEYLQLLHEAGYTKDAKPSELLTLIFEDDERKPQKGYDIALEMLKTKEAAPKEINLVDLTNYIFVGTPVYTDKRLLTEHESLVVMSVIGRLVNKLNGDKFYDNKTEIEKIYSDISKAIKGDKTT